MHGIGYQLTVDSISHYSSTLFTGPWLLLYPGSVSMPNVTSTMTFADPLFFFFEEEIACCENSCNMHYNGLLESLKDVIVLAGLRKIGTALRSLMIK